MVSTRARRRLVILLANEVVRERSNLLPAGWLSSQQLAIFDDGLARQALEGAFSSAITWLSSHAAPCWEG